MTHTQTATAEALDRANAVISDLVNALDAVSRTDNLHFAHGAAEQAIRNANAARVRNQHGYLAVLPR